MRLRASESPAADGPTFSRHPAREAHVGGGHVRRTLPTAGRRTIGPWCFADTYGPVPDAERLAIGPHPHTGLQTVTWLLSGELEHRDSLGSVQRIRPGQLNWMTAGRGIVHAELGVAGPIEGAQLWVALPSAHRHTGPAFLHLPDLPAVQQAEGHATVLVGELAGQASPAPRFHPIVGAELRGTLDLPLDPDFEHGVLPLRGSATVDGEPVAPHTLVYLGRGRERLTVSTDVALLLGGQPLGEPLLMWWNFVERTHEEVVASRARWEAGAMATVPNTAGRIAAPPLRGA